MHGYHFLPAFWLPFLLWAIFVKNAIPQAQFDFNVLFNHDGPTGNLGQGGDSDFFPKEAYPILLNDQLLTPEPPLDVFVVENNHHNCRSSSSSSDNNAQSFLVGKREVLVCLPPKPKSSPDPTPDSTPDFIPDSIPDSTPDSTPSSTLSSTPDPTPDPTPELIAPQMKSQESDNEKCPPKLMGMSRIPVCDSGRPGEDMMRLSGLTYYTLFKITPDQGSGCVHPSWPWCCATIGKQRHPLWLARDDVTTGYICRYKEREELSAEYPDPELERLMYEDGKDLEHGWKRKAKRAEHGVMPNDILLRI